MARKVFSASSLALAILLVVVLGEVSPIEGNPRLKSADNKPDAKPDAKPGSDGKKGNKEADYQYDEDDPEYNDDYTADDRQRDSEINFEPAFRSQGSTFTVDKGTTISLPCAVDKLPVNFVLMWKRIDPVKGEVILSVDKMTYTTDDARVKVDVNHATNPGSTLNIALARAEDAGQYICEMAGKSQYKIKHTVYIRDPPKIRKDPENGLLLAKKGDSVTLSCHGQGSPEPKITWTRAGKAMPDGRDSLDATELTFPSVSRAHAGVYVCRADNGFGTDAQERITLDVEYSPEVEVQEVFVHALAGNRVELVCAVHAHPKAEVRWMKGDIAVGTGQGAVVSDMHNRHTLTFSSLREEDFGNYTCRAKNRMGEASRILEISGHAAFPHFVSNPSGREPDNYLIEWTAQSHTPITKFALKYRKHGASATEWTHVDVEPNRLNSLQFAGKHSLTQLQAATQYEARVASHNDRGWSRPSQTFNFATFGAEPISDASKDAGNMNTIHPILVLVVTLLSVLITKCL